jgi:NAD(P)-dependent dehydrogenase (short-subunit alcohol dehydrogenase family)
MGIGTEGPIKTDARGAEPIVPPARSRFHRKAGVGTPSSPNSTISCHPRRIVVTTSTAATKTSPAAGTPYLAAKAAIAHLVRRIALELARYRITVNAIQPGPFETRITTPELLPIFEQSSPSHRIGRPDEIGGIALFFASDASGFVTGAQYNLDGGQLLGRAD